MSQTAKQRRDAAKAAAAAKVAEAAAMAALAATTTIEPVEAVEPAGEPVEPTTGKLARVGRPDDFAAKRHYGQGMAKYIDGRPRNVRALPQAEHYIRALRYPGNPYKPGTKAAATYDLFTDAEGNWRTVEQVKRLASANPNAYDTGYIRYATRDGYAILEPHAKP
jgi:hypothetical protein